MTFRNECGKVNELLMSNEITKEFEKSFEKNLKKFLTNENERDKLNELSQESKKHKRTLITKQ